MVLLYQVLETVAGSRDISRCFEPFKTRQTMEPNIWNTDDFKGLSSKSIYRFSMDTKILKNAFLFDVENTVLHENVFK